ncbi:MAG: glycoside hydrolase family 5 protein [Scytonema sp. PMC 1069.18]|nr:glycoside hydrolase family 5 protein [Scytonema sp. PMC 1069.18]MEC4884318.1 glycoside hydrolase family 5 protein [Scytonema sp. PMC 1070.18]
MNLPQRLLKKLVKYIAVGLVLIILYGILNYNSSQLFARLHNNQRSPITSNIVTPLYARGSRIVDARGRTVLLQGINWFGMELKTHAPNGLWVRDYKDMLAQIKSLGYNSVRLPYSVEALRSKDISGIDFSIGANQDFQGKTPLEVMDLVLQEAERQELLILLDSHTLKDDRIPELWYGDGYTEKDWIDTWVLLAKRYKNYKNVIGADLKNEPHGRASWGTNDPDTDWRLAAERAGNKILQVNPNWLILVEGVEKNVPKQKQWGYVWGSNLEGVSKYPVRLKKAKKLVYSPHEYGSSEYDWFKEKSFPHNLYKRWEIGFHYIATRAIAPIWVGEFGGYHVDDKSKEGIWQQRFVNYLKQKKLHFTYWCLNPNSKGTGGILLDDWRNINVPKQALLSKALKSNQVNYP